MRRGPGDTDGELPAASLIEISRVLEETARLVREHAEREERPYADPTPWDVAKPRPIGPMQIRAVLALRRLRRDYLGAELPEAAWVLMLELYRARLEGRLVNQTRLGIDAGVAQTTALNVIRRLVAKGIFVSGTQDGDRRGVVVGLSDSAAERLGRYLAAAFQVAPLLV